jgi:cerevisin
MGFLLQGVRTTHTEFGGRATFGKSFGDGVPGQDIQGHGKSCQVKKRVLVLTFIIGTHVAGIAASALHGVAKSANIIAVKVMEDDGTGSGSNIISGINFVVQAVAQSSRPSVINMSITTPGSRAIDEAVANAVSFGIHVVVAAGNESKDAGDDSPARSSAVIAVGATDISDSKASFSNFGPDVNIWAPGVGIISLGTASDTAVKTLDGTSMACPFVTGLVAYFLALEGTMSPLSMKQRLRSLTTSGIISNLRMFAHMVLRGITLTSICSE